MILNSVIGNVFETPWEDLVFFYPCTGSKEWGINYFIGLLEERYWEDLKYFLPMMPGRLISHHVSGRKCLHGIVIDPKGVENTLKAIETALGNLIPDNFVLILTGDYLEQTFGKESDIITKVLTVLQKSPKKILIFSRNKTYTIPPI
jgi:hypothetical protein